MIGRKVFIKIRNNDRHLTDIFEEIINIRLQVCHAEKV